MPNKHKHKCDGCGFIWEHVRATEASSAEYHKLHDCAVCGLNQREVYYAPGEEPARAKAVRELLDFLFS